MARLKSQIGKSVRFSAPKDVGKKGGGASVGKIIDEIWVDPDLNESPRHPAPCPDSPNCWGDYSFCAQLIEWSDADRSHSIRLAYFRRRCGEDHWEFASQMTVNSDVETIKALCERTLAMIAAHAPR